MLRSGKRLVLDLPPSYVGGELVPTEDLLLQLVNRRKSRKWDVECVLERARPKKTRALPACFAKAPEEYCEDDVFPDHYPTDQSGMAGDRPGRERSLQDGAPERFLVIRKK